MGAALALPIDAAAMAAAKTEVIRRLADMAYSLMDMISRKSNLHASLHFDWIFSTLDAQAH
jgi:hypothetical protein